MLQRILRRLTQFLDQGDPLGAFQVIALEDSVFIEAFGPGPMLTTPIGEMVDSD